MDLTSDPPELPPLPPPPQPSSLLTSDVIIIDGSNLSMRDNPSLIASQTLLSSDSLLDNNPFLSEKFSTSPHRPAISYNRKRGPSTVYIDRSNISKEPRISQPI